jgi:hypothetical protein
METIKKFDSVKFMIEIREKLSEKYWKHPDILKKEMEAIREKYKLKLSEPNITKNIKINPDKKQIDTIRLVVILPNCPTSDRG